MRYLTFTPEKGQYPVILLSQNTQMSLLAKYVQRMEDDVVVYGLPYSKKPPNKATLLAWFNDFLPIAAQLKTDYLMVADAAYFKAITGAVRVDRVVGYVLPCLVKNYEHLHVVYVPPAGALLRDPVVQSKVDQARNAIIAHRQGRYVSPGCDIVKFAEYPSEVQEISDWLDKLVKVPLAIDIETFALKHYSAGIGTMTMCWSESEGIAFAVDKDNSPEKAAKIRALLLAFFRKRRAMTMYHRSWFDIYVLVYQLFMKNVLDTEGMLEGLEVMLHGFEDTILLRYLATNSCSGNKLSLKEAAQEYVGNYSVEVKDISKVPLDQLLPYNLYDGLATWFVYNKHMPDVVNDQQLPIYEELFKPMMSDIIQMQLTGLPIDMEEVIRGKAIMVNDRSTALNAVLATPEVQHLNTLIADAWAVKRNSELKVKRVTPSDCKDTFNINSNLQLQTLLHEVMGLPILEVTPSGLPATGMDNIEDLMAHATAVNQKTLLQHLIAYKQVEKILSSFIPAFEAAFLAPDGWHYLYGVFNPGGTLSGRLSSSDPNLQNLPSSGSKYSKLIKKMFRAPPGKLFVGLDFNSLEDMISALTTKDPNKMACYLEGFDGHCLRSYYYFQDRMPDIERAPENAQCYRANVGGTDVYFHTQEDVEYLGQVMKGDALHALLVSQGL